MGVTRGEGCGARSQGKPAISVPKRTRLSATAEAGATPLLNGRYLHVRLSERRKVAVDTRVLLRVCRRNTRSLQTCPLSAGHLLLERANLAIREIRDVDCVSLAVVSHEL